MDVFLYIIKDGKKKVNMRLVSSVTIHSFVYTNKITLYRISIKYIKFP